MQGRTTIQRDLDEFYRTCERRRTLGRPRRGVAYALKAIAGGGSLIVASAFFPSSDQVVGFAVLAAILADSLTANHLRLIGDTKAGHAYAAILRTIVPEHSRKHSPLIAEAKPLLKKQEQNVLGSEEAQRLATIEGEIDSLEAETHEKLSTRINEIETARAELDIKALTSLELDDKGGQKQPK